MLGHRDHPWPLMKNFRYFSGADYGGFLELEDGDVYGALQ